MLVTTSQRDEFVSLVRRADSSGFSVVTGPDHVGSRLAAVLPMLSAAAEVSSRLRISPMVLANDFRHPVLLAKDTATMDILSEGRFELGIGTGGSNRSTTQLVFDTTRQA
jgi:alkanesulfonate monooxygenase SsuD/methylene tetrahydromethanopterin reductase-like flavin-dependent oxidoreductase (luciferase family)